MAAADKTAHDFSDLICNYMLSLEGWSTLDLERLRDLITDELWERSNMEGIVPSEDSYDEL